MSSRYLYFGWDSTFLFSGEYSHGTYEDVCARIKYLGQEQVITSHSICGM